METSAQISVIIPAFNRAPYIEETLASVFEQEYPNIEVLVVDDGSSDGTYEILEKYRDQGAIELLTHAGRANLGQSAALNFGLRKASGEYIAFLDSDDMFASGKLEQQARFLASNPDVGMVYGQAHAVDAEGNFLFEVPNNEHEEPGDPNLLLLDCYMALPGGALIRKSVLDKVGFFEETFRAGQDHDMALRIMEATNTAYLPELAFYYRKHGDSISAKGLERRWKTGIEILDRARKRYPYRKSTIRKRRAVLHFRLGQTYWRKGSRVKALPHLVTSGVLDPARALSVIFGRE